MNSQNERGSGSDHEDTIADKIIGPDIENDLNLTQHTCRCLKNYHILVVEIKENIFSMREMSKVEKEMYVVGVLQKGVFGQVAQRKTERKRMTYFYSFSGETVCR